jgi:hypothetical protein
MGFSLLLERNQDITHSYRAHTNRYDEMMAPFDAKG